ncbi:MAG: hypothetical protein WD077_08415 [Bacteroidia bacterium]
MSKEKIVHIVHSVDTEGPLYESLSSTFKRIKDIFGLELEATKENLRKIQQRELNFSGKEEQLYQMFSSGQLSFLDDYGKVDEMLEHIGSESFRMKVPDSFGNGWIYNWHCVDHVGYSINPRRKDIGFHNIFDHYKDLIARNNWNDNIHWHFHPAHHSGASHISATSYINDNRFLEIITRRILERNWFPSVNRAGFHTERPDSHWLLEQWIPFDLSNQAHSEGGEQDDLGGGRFGDWRRAPKDWQVYNPSHDDYQVPGSCRRHIGRCLNVGSRLRLLREEDIRQAFDEAQQKGQALVGLTNHDFRNMAPDVDAVRSILNNVSNDYPDVKFKYSEAREAFNYMIFGDYRKPPRDLLDVVIVNGRNRNQRILKVRAKERIFGPQPFLAIETKDGRFLHDNFDFEEPFVSWHYTFDYQTINLDQIKKIGVATNDVRGYPHVSIMDIEKENLL